MTADPLMVHQGLIQCSIGEMRGLKNAFSENVMLQVRQGAHRIIIEELKGDRLPFHFWGKGMSAPIHTGASGKLLLSELDDKELSILFEKIDLFPVGSRTITSKEAMLLELNRIRKRGYAFSNSEHHEGVYAVAVPVRNYFCPVALAISGHEAQMREKKDSILGKLKVSSAKISENLKKNDKEE